MVVVTISTLDMPVLFDVMHLLARRLVSFLQGELVVSVDKLLLQLLKWTSRKSKIIDLRLIRKRRLLILDLVFVLLFGLDMAHGLFSLGISFLSLRKVFGCEKKKNMQPFFYVQVHRPM